MSAALAPAPPALAVSPTAAARAVDGARSELARAKTPIAINRARLSADILSRALENAVKAGVPDLVEFSRETQLLVLEGAIRLGETALSPANGKESRILGTKALGLRATEAHVPRNTLRDMAKLALARLLREADFDALVVRALDKGKQPPLAKLRALAKGPPKDEDDRPEPEAGEDQIAFRVPKWLGAELDLERMRGEGEKARATWVREHLDRVLARRREDRLDELVRMARDVGDELAARDLLRWRGVVTNLEHLVAEIDAARRK